MKNISSDTEYGDKSLNSNNVLVMGHLMLPEAHHHNTEGNRVHLTKGNPDAQVTPFAVDALQVVDGRGHPRDPCLWTSGQQLPTWLAPWPDKFSPVCRACHKSGHPCSRTPSGSHVLINDPVVNGVNGTCEQNGIGLHCAMCDLFAVVSADPSNRMVRSVSLGRDLHAQTDMEEGDCLIGDGGCRDTQQRRRGSDPVDSGVPRSGHSTLSAVLESIPLAYDPKTKKLHIIEVAKSSGDTVATNGPGTVHPQDCVAKPIPNHHNNNNNIDTGERGAKVTGWPQEPLLSGGDWALSVLNRVATSGSLPSRTECSSFSSVSSLSTDFSTALEDLVEAGDSLFLEPDETGFIEINLDRQSTGKSVGSGTPSDACSLDECLALSQGAKPKRRGLSGFFSGYVHGVLSASLPFNCT